MIASVLSEKYNVLKTEGNFNNEIGLPLTVFNIREEHEVAVLEMGISHFGDMKPLAKIARPDVCVITNIGYAHLENLGTRDGILKEKSSMTDYMNPKGSVIFNRDDKLKSYTSRDGRTPVYFGLTSSCPFHVENIERKGLKGTYAEFVTPTSRFHAHISIPGDHMIYNALAGVAVGYALGMNNDEIARGIEKLIPIAGRNNLIEAKHYTIIDDCYNANPASMKSSLTYLHMQTQERSLSLAIWANLVPMSLRCTAKSEHMQHLKTLMFWSASEHFLKIWQKLQRKLFLQQRRT